MNKIGFYTGTEPPDDSIREQLALLPESALDLTIQQRAGLLSQGLGQPIPKIFSLGEQEVADGGGIPGGIADSSWIPNRRGAWLSFFCDAWSVPKM